MPYNKLDIRKISERIKEERKLANLTQEELGELIYRDKKSIRQWEKAVSLPDRDSLFSLCTVFKCDINYILCLSDTKDQSLNDIFHATGLTEDSLKIIIKLHHSIIKENTIQQCQINLHKRFQLKLIDEFIKQSEELTKDIFKLDFLKTQRTEKILYDFPYSNLENLLKGAETPADFNHISEYIKEYTDSKIAQMELEADGYDHRINRIFRNIIDSIAMPKLEDSLFYQNLILGKDDEV